MTKVKKGTRESMDTWDVVESERLAKAWTSAPLTPVQCREVFGVEVRTVHRWLRGKANPGRVAAPRVRKWIAAVRAANRKKFDDFKEGPVRVEFPTAKEPPLRFRFFKVPGDSNATFVAARLVNKSHGAATVRQDPVVIGNVRDVHGKWCANWKCPHQMTNLSISLSGFATREEAATALVKAKEALGVR